MTHRTPSRSGGLLVLLLLALGLLSWAAWGPTGPVVPQRAVGGGSAATEITARRESVDSALAVEAPSRPQVAPMAERAASDPADPAPAPLAVEVQGMLVHPLVEDLSGIPVFLVRAGGSPILRAECSSQGRFRFDASTPGRWTLRIASSKTSWVEDRVLELERAPLVLDPIELPPLGLVEVTVVDERGTTVPDVEVRIDGASGEQPGRRTDSLGRLRVHLPEGTYRFHASDPRLGRGNQALDLAADSTAEIEVRLHGGRP